MLASDLDIAGTMGGQAGQGARDQELLEVVDACERQTEAQLAWLTTWMKQAAPQAVLVAT